MKVKILTFIPKEDTGTWVDLKKGEIIALDDELAMKLIKNKQAEWEI